MDLSLRPTLNTGNETDDYCVIHDGRSVGRIRLAGERSRQCVAAWEWRINPPLPIPPWCNGTADSLEGRKGRVQGRVGAVLCIPDAGADQALAPH